MDRFFLNAGTHADNRAVFEHLGRGAGLLAEALRCMAKTVLTGPSAQLTTHTKIVGARARLIQLLLWAQQKVMDHETDPELASRIVELGLSVKLLAEADTAPPDEDRGRMGTYAELRQLTLPLLSATSTLQMGFGDTNEHWHQIIDFPRNAHFQALRILRLVHPGNEKLLKLDAHQYIPEQDRFWLDSLVGPLIDDRLRDVERDLRAAGKL